MELMRLLFLLMFLNLIACSSVSYRQTNAVTNALNPTIKQNEIQTEITIDNTRKLRGSSTAKYLFGVFEISGPILFLDNYKDRKSVV